MNKSNSDLWVVKFRKGPKDLWKPIESDSLWNTEQRAEMEAYRKRCSRTQEQQDWEYKVDKMSRQNDFRKTKRQSRPILRKQQQKKSGAKPVKLTSGPKGLSRRPLGLSKG